MLLGVFFILIRSKDLKKAFSFCIVLTYSYRWLRRKYSRSPIKKKKGFFFLYCSHLFVPLHSF